MDYRLKNDHYIYLKAVEMVVQEQSCSAMMLQRRLRIGFVYAARLIEQMELEGIVSEFRNSGREVLIDNEQLEQIWKEKGIKRTNDFEFIQ